MASRSGEDAAGNPAKGHQAATFTAFIALVVVTMMMMAMMMVVVVVASPFIVVVIAAIVGMIFQHDNHVSWTSPSPTSSTVGVSVVLFVVASPSHAFVHL